MTKKDWVDYVPKEIDMDDLIETYVGNLNFDTLLAWADILDVGYDVDMWLDDMWTDCEDELRVEVAQAMTKVGEKN